MKRSYEHRTDLMVSAEIDKFEKSMQHMPVGWRSAKKTFIIEFHRRELMKQIIKWKNDPSPYGRKMWKVKVGEAALYDNRFPPPWANEQTDEQADVQIPLVVTYWGTDVVSQNPNFNWRDPFRAKRTQSSPAGEERALTPKGTRTDG